MVKKEKAFVVAPRSLFDLMTTNDLTQLCISVTGVNPHDTSPGNQLLTQRKKLLPDTESETVEHITAEDVRDARDRAGYSALHMAAAFNHPEAVQKLVEEYHCDIDARADNGKTPLWVAVEYGNMDIAQYLVAKGANIMLVVREGDGETMSLLALAHRKQQHYFVYKLEAALQKSFPTVGKDPVQCAIDGDINYFVLESDRIEGCKLANEVDDQMRFSKISFAKDNEGNSIIATIAKQFSITAEQLVVLQFLVQRKLFGDVNEKNAQSNTALHSLAAVCHEKEVGEDLQRRAALFDLLVEHGADVRRKNAQNQTPLQCTENVVLKAFVVAEEKHQEYLDMYHKRNQVPYSERPAFAAAIKTVKRAWRQARREAEAALANPSEAHAAPAAAAGEGEGPAAPTSSGGSVQATPRSARSALTLTLQLLSAKGLQAKDAVQGTSDPFCAVFVGGSDDVAFRSAVAPGTIHPTWENATTTLQIDIGTKLTFKLFDKDVMGEDTLGTAELTVTDDRLDGKPFELPIQNGTGTLTVSLRKS